MAPFVWQDSPSTSTPLNAANLAAAFTEKADLTDVRFTDARAPVAHTQASSTITDFTAAVNALIGAGGIGYSKTETDGLITAVQDSMATVDDLLISWTRETTIPASGNTTIPLLTCPFPLKVKSLSVVTFQTGAGVSTSDTNWWLTRVRYTRQSVTNTAVNIATKTTRATAGTEPAGEAITIYKAWTYLTTDLAAVSLVAGDVINMIFAPQGTPATIITPIIITLGYQPL